MPDCYICAKFELPAPKPATHMCSELNRPLCADHAKYCNEDGHTATSLMPQCAIIDFMLTLLKLYPDSELEEDAIVAGHRDGIISFEERQELMVAL